MPRRNCSSVREHVATGSTRWRALAATRDLAEIGSQIVAATREMMDASAAALYQRDGSVYRLQAASGLALAEGTLSAPLTTHLEWREGDGNGVYPLWDVSELREQVPRLSEGPVQACSPHGWSVRVGRQAC